MRDNSVGILLALVASCLGAVACGAATDGQGSAEEGPPAKIGHVASALHGNVSGCGSAWADTFWGISPDYMGDITSTEPVPTNRSSTCDAWVSQFSFSSQTGAPKAYYFLNTSNPLPNDQANCQGVWESRQIAGTWTGNWQVLQAGDFYATWDGFSCQYPNTPLMPSQCTTNCTNGILQLWNASSYVDDWAKTWTSVRTVNQSFFIFWEIPGQTTLELTR